MARATLTWFMCCCSLVLFLMWTSRKWVNHDGHHTVKWQPNLSSIPEKDKNTLKEEEKEVYEERNRKIRRVCSKYPSSGTIFFHAFTDKQLIIDKVHGLIYCRHGKVYICDMTQKHIHVYETKL